MSHSALVRLLEYGMGARLDGFLHLKAEARRCQMGSIVICAVEKETGLTSYKILSF